MFTGQIVLTNADIDSKYGLNFDSSDVKAFIAETRIIATMGFRDKVIYDPLQNSQIHKAFTPTVNTIAYT